MRPIFGPPRRGRFRPENAGPGKAPPKNVPWPGVRYANGRGNEAEGWTWDCLVRTGSRKEWAVVGVEIRARKHEKPVYWRRVTGIQIEGGDPAMLEDAAPGEKGSLLHHWSDLSNTESLGIVLESAIRSVLPELAGVIAGWILEQSVTDKAPEREESSPVSGEDP